MSTDTRLRQALSNLLVAYAASNGEDHPAYLEAEAALNGKKTRRLGSGPSIIRDEARRSGGTGDYPLLPPEPAAPKFVPEPEPNLSTLGKFATTGGVEIKIVGQIHFERILGNGKRRGNGVSDGDRGDMVAFVVANFDSLNTQPLPGREVPGDNVADCVTGLVPCSLDIWEHGTFEGLQKLSPLSQVEEIGRHSVVSGSDCAEPETPGDGSKPSPPVNVDAAKPTQSPRVGLVGSRGSLAARPTVERARLSGSADTYSKEAAPGEINPGSRARVSVDRPLFGADLIQHLSQSERDVFTEKLHGEIVDAVGEARLNDDDGPAVVGFLNGAIDGISGEHMALRDNARAQESPSRRVVGDTTNVEEMLQSTTASPQTNLRASGAHITVADALQVDKDALAEVTGVDVEKCFSVTVAEDVRPSLDIVVRFSELIGEVQLRRISVGSCVATIMNLHLASSDCAASESHSLLSSSATEGSAE